MEKGFKVTPVFAKQMTLEKFEGKRRMAAPVPSMSMLFGRANRDFQKTSCISQAGALGRADRDFQKTSLISQAGALAIVIPAATLTSGGAHACFFFCLFFFAKK